MEESGIDGTANPAHATDLKSNPPSPKPSPKKLVVRNLSSRLKSRKSSTPYPARSDGFTKRLPLPSIPEGKPVRKKISFDTPLLPLAEENEGNQVGGSGSSPDIDAPLASVPEEHFQLQLTGFASGSVQADVSDNSSTEQRPYSPISGGPKEGVGDESCSDSTSVMMMEEQAVQPMLLSAAHPNCRVPTMGMVGAVHMTLQKGMSQTHFLNR